MCLKIVNIRRGLGGGGGAVKSEAHETPIHEITQEDINTLLSYGYKVNDDRLPVPKNKPSYTGKTDQPLCK